MCCNNYSGYALLTGAAIGYSLKNFDTGVTTAIASVITTEASSFLSDCCSGPEQYERNSNHTIQQTMRDATVGISVSLITARVFSDMGFSPIAMFASTLVAGSLFMAGQYNDRSMRQSQETLPRHVTPESTTWS